MHQDDETKLFSDQTPQAPAQSAPQPAAPVSGDPNLLKNRYRIEKELGRGGFGIVYLARDTQLVSKPVVIKILTQDYSQDSWSLRKFHQEMEALARIDHPGVIGALDTGQTADGKPFLVMQFVEGVTLRTLIREGGIDLERTAAILRQIGSGLGAAHDKGVWHRDLKPENVMLQSIGAGEEYVKLIDFGIAAIADSSFAPGGNQQTRVVGSFSYMAPEQFENKPCAQSDVYAMGVLAYEMITGRKPFSSDSLFHHITDQQKGPAAKPRELRPDLPETAEAAILKALSRDIAARFASTREFGEAFYKAIHPGAQTVVTPPPPPPPSRAEAPTQEVTGTSSGRLEVAHVLFLDLVGYSTMPMDRQTGYLAELQAIVKATNAFKDAEKSGNLIRLPTGDGMALIFFQDPVAPVECAIAIGKELRQRTHLQLRAGIHSGPVYRIADINTNMNVAGGGINMAQRVMDCGDAGHILVSETVADTLKQLSGWSTNLVDLGDVAVKHGVMVHVFSLCTDEAGNRALPKKIAKTKQTQQSRRGAVIAAGVGLIAVAGGAAYFLWPVSYQRNINYSITLRTVRDNVPGAPTQLASAYVFSPDHQIKLNVNSSEAGHFYLLNDGPLAPPDNGESINVLSPGIDSSSSMATNWTMQVPPEDHWTVFDAAEGTEKLYIVWSIEPIEALEKAAKGQVGQIKEGSVVITDPAQLREYRQLLEGLAADTIAESDEQLKQTALRSEKPAMAYLVKLEHH